MDAIENEYTLLGYRNIIVRLPPDKLNLIAAQPDVVSIQPYGEPRKQDERQDQIVAGNLSGIAPSGPGYLAWLASVGFGQGDEAKARDARVDRLSLARQSPIPPPELGAAQEALLDIFP